MNGAFNSQILAEKLTKLNNSQQSIETLSHWCIFHRKKARQVVETWNKKFHDLKEQQVAYLYLANDILQNSRRRGGEFVSEFWKILPGALKEIVEKGDDHGRRVVMRLVDIWEQRKVFGSRGRSLREELLGKDPPPDLPSCEVKASHHMIKIKVPAGGIQEKLISSYRSLHDVGSEEDATLGRCNAAVIRVEGLEKEADSLQVNAEIQDTTLVDELQEQRNILIHCREQLEMSQLARAALVAHLKEALREQESKLELIRTQLQIAQARAEHVLKVRNRLLNPNSNMGEIIQQGPNESGIEATRQVNDTQQQASFSGSLLASTREDPNVTPRSATSMVAAEVAAKLAASTSSAQMLASVLSSLAAEEAAGGSTVGTMSAPLDAPPLLEKRQRVDGGSSLVEDRLLLHGNSTSAAFLKHHYQQLPSSALLPPLPPPPPLYISNDVSSMSGIGLGIPYGLMRGGSVSSSHLSPPLPHPQFIPHMMMGSLNNISYPPPQPPPGVNGGMYGQPPLPGPPPPRP